MKRSQRYRNVSHFVFGQRVLRRQYTDMPVNTRPSLPAVNLK